MDRMDHTDHFRDIDSCQHIDQVLNSKAKDNVILTYKQAAKVSLLISDENDFTLIKDNSPVPFFKLKQLQSQSLKCSTCHLNNFNNNFICLQCPNVGCKSGYHGYNHYKLNQHLFAIDSRNGLLYCFKCSNYVNNKVLNDVRQQILQVSSNQNIMSLQHNNHNEITSYSNFDDEIEGYGNPSNKSIRGLKGIINFGATCFMSSIIQTLIHNPIMKHEFFNNDDHYFNCDQQECITCSVDHIFSIFYTNDDIESFGMTKLLISSWHKNKSLAGFQEQDAHEFLQFLLNEFHKDHERLNGESENCQCLTHKIFYGELESTIECLNCSELTQTYDPILDLSLEIDNLKKDSTLHDCLDLFTSNEKLENEYKCNYCNTSSKPFKSLKINKLAPILSIQLKRFKHNLTNYVKIDSLIKIPLYLDLSKYFSQDSPNRSKPFYELFALVCHAGSVNTGHYIVIIKTPNNQWMRIDDSIITLVPSSEIEYSNPYLVFYILHDI